MSAQTYRLAGHAQHPYITGEGGTLTPGGDSADIDPDHPTNRLLIDEGLLLPVGPARPSTVKELQARAGELGVEGRSAMKADELRDAIATAELDAAADADANPDLT